MRIFKELILNFKIKFSYVKYIKKIQNIIDNSLTLEIITIDNKIKDIYLLLLNDNIKYNKYIAMYDELILNTKSYNEKLSFINSFTSSFDYSALLNDPKNINLEELNQYLFCAYNFKDRLKLYPKIDDIIQNYDNICYQFENKNYIENPIQITDKYITKKELYSLNFEYKKIAEKFKNNYYNIKILDNLNDIVDNINNSYVLNHINDTIFNDINNKSLDNEQRSAILRDDNACLTIAGAGSGKTLTICGKVKYLLERKGIKPSEILLLSYSKKSADDLSEKMKQIDHGLKVGTFHKIGLEVLKNTTNQNYLVEDQFEEIIDRYFREEINKKPQMANKLLKYYAFYMNANDKVYKNKDEQFKDLKELDYTTLKDFLGDLSPNISKRKTLKKEYVKSYEELAIANYYFINGINYTYEKKYEFSTTSLDDKLYRPDFYLNDYNIYHEHYGIDRNGNANQFGKEESIKYVEYMAIKRRAHIANNTNCIETFSYQFKENTILDNLKQLLIKNGVKFKPLSNEQVFNALNSIYLDKEFNSFINTIKTFISLYKARYKDNTHFDELLSSKENFNKPRFKLFVDICKDIYNYYYEIIRNENKIDFDDMILRSTEQIAYSNDYKYKYVIVDEFQDISFSRMKFLKAIINHGNSKLFAVGDDYQAIYRFSGCDLNIFTKFSKYFGDSVINKVQTTHRNSQELQNIVNPFICKNINQIKKDIKSNKHEFNPINIMYYENNKTVNFNEILRLISDENPFANILVLGRINNDIKSILSKDIKYNYKKNIITSDEFPCLHIYYSTVHSSKGLEEDYVILINCENSKMGFPNKIEDDPVLSLVLSEEENYPFAEERRLFYVALTRTRNKVFLLVDSTRESIFVKEIKDICNVINPIIKNNEIERICPKCHGKLRKVDTKDGHFFFACENYPYCEYKIDNYKAYIDNIRCPNCNDFMIFRRAKNGSVFYGCHSYPHCKTTLPYFKK